ncbi:hypothetical protein SALBM135S_07605 [Streptomyces alboniger]
MRVNESRVNTTRTHLYEPGVPGSGGVPCRLGAPDTRGAAPSPLRPHLSAATSPVSYARITSCTRSLASSFDRRRVR